MPGPEWQRSDFLETYAVHAALKSAIKSGLYRNNRNTEKAATRLFTRLAGSSSIYGRQQKMIRLMRKGATIARLCKGLKCSRRTVFRYFHDLADAGIEVELDETRYFVAKDATRLIS